MTSKLTKSEAIARFLGERPSINLDKSATHFANINAGKEVWWYDIPCAKVKSGRHEALHLLAHDRRTDELHHLVVPTKHLLDNLDKLAIRPDKDTISLELSASRSNFLTDVRPGGKRLPFSQFLQK